ncbi:hypothetical protein MPH_08576 [Macrophomina phaseolina MS6]|uniref:Dickkopf N-terminal cysteine-rich domain-containing protein n=1 Tax=Macrophomina phaseolina (strain MS6) TaxID=1126212 RepID=K2RI03_MACPH|nr:hypothetical protein MPH_08576 [Macrophomina phaseolina MS6]
MLPSALLLGALASVVLAADNYRAGAAGTACAANSDCSSYRCSNGVCLDYLGKGEQCTFDLNCGGDFVCVTQPEGRGECGMCIDAWEPCYGGRDNRAPNNGCCSGLVCGANEDSPTLRICRPPDLNPGTSS